MHWEIADVRMSGPVAAALFLKILYDPATTEEQKNKLVNCWNEHAKKGRRK